MASLSAVAPTPKKQPWLDHRTVWRWHFYAGLFCIPFVLWLSITGTVFLYSEQIQSFLDRGYNHLPTNGQIASVNDQVVAALAAKPGFNLHAYQPPHDSTSPAEILIGKGRDEFRVYVNPRTLQVLKVDNEDRRIDHFSFRLHGEMLLGNKGSYIVELAASWTVIMIVTGLFLWWPSNVSGLAGVLYPRLKLGKRMFWKDIHSVIGIYVSIFALFLLFTGLPWAKAWGTYFRAARKIAGTHAPAGSAKPWVTSSAEEKAARVALNNDPMAGMNMKAKGPQSSLPAGDPFNAGGEGSPSKPSMSNAYVSINKIYATVAPLNLPYPVHISPPTQSGGAWIANSVTRNIPVGVTLLVDGGSGAVLKRTEFKDKPWIDRVVGAGIAAHEGALFGWLNKVVSTLTVIGLVALSISGLLMWWKRKPEGVLGAPTLIRKLRFSSGLLAFLVVFGLYFPLFGVSMIAVVITEKWILRRVPFIQRWLGLQPVHPQLA